MRKSTKSEEEKRKYRTTSKVRKYGGRHAGKAGGKAGGSLLGLLRGSPRDHTELEDEKRKSRGAPKNTNTSNQYHRYTVSHMFRPPRALQGLPGVNKKRDEDNPKSRGRLRKVRKRCENTEERRK